MKNYDEDGWRTLQGKDKNKMVHLWEKVGWRTERLPVEIWNYGCGEFAIVLHNGKGLYTVIQEYTSTDHILWRDIYKAWERQKLVVVKLNKKWWEFWK
jgi:hypothetical protein